MVLSLFLFAITALVVFLIPVRQSGAELPSASDPSAPTSAVTPLPALTTYRAHMLLMTVLAILAVDFPVFPRSLAKCETFGVSLVIIHALLCLPLMISLPLQMDIGVGSFVFSQGLVSAIPIIKDPTYLSSPFVSKMTNTLKKVLPILVIGVIRVLLVKGTDYPVCESHLVEFTFSNTP
jgi:phosphatidylinositol glycan class W